MQKFNEYSKLRDNECLQEDWKKMARNATLAAASMGFGGGNAQSQTPMTQNAQTQTTKVSSGWQDEAYYTKPIYKLITYKYKHGSDVVPLLKQAMYNKELNDKFISNANRYQLDNLTHNIESLMMDRNKLKKNDSQISNLEFLDSPQAQEIISTIFQKYSDLSSSRLDDLDKRIKSTKMPAPTKPSDRETQQAMDAIDNLLRPD